MPLPSRNQGHRDRDRRRRNGHTSSFDEYVIHLQNQYKALKTTIFEKNWSLKSKSRFRHDKYSDFQLPSLQHCFRHPIWKMEGMKNLKNGLKHTKDKLNEMDIKIWHTHTAQMNPNYYLKFYLLQTHNAELASRAWGKMMECLVTQSLVPDFLANENELNTVHLCEAPGAFLAAINHFVHTKYPQLKWTWLATSLNPYYEGMDVDYQVIDDTLIRKYVDKWAFLEDNTGNLLDGKNMQSLISQVHKKFGRSGVHLVTADGSIDCQRDPSEQESLVSQLQYAEIISGLSILGIGGSFMLKIFTFFECATICNIFLLSCLFDDVNLYKPACSKEGNSELYLICTGFNGKPKDFDVLFLAQNGSIHNALFQFQDIPPFFLNRLYRAADFFKTKQEDAIKRNLFSYFQYTPNPIHRHVREEQREIAMEWMRRFQIEDMNSNLRLIPSKQFSTRATELGAARLYHFRAHAPVDLLEFKEWAKARLEYCTKKTTKSEAVTLLAEIRGAQRFKIRPAATTVGKSFKNILNSGFCLPTLMSLRNQIRNLVDARPYLVPFYEFDEQPHQHCSLAGNKQKINSIVRKFQEPHYKSWDLDVNLCFHETLHDLTYTIDMDSFSDGLAQIIEALTNLKKQSSIFLCEYPMLSRLQVGVIFVISSIFKKVKISFSTATKLHGIFLYQFLGFESQPGLNSALCDILKNLQSLEYMTKGTMMLECIPTGLLTGDSDMLDSLKAYNEVMMARGIRQHVEHIHEALLKDEKARKRTKKNNRDTKFKRQKLADFDSESESEYGVYVKKV